MGTMKGVGRIYQQTFIDTYSKVVQAKLYTTKTPITAADLLNDRVLPLFEHHELPMLRMLTDRGTEYCGRADQHDYELYLALNDIDHTRTKARSPQTNGICERFHKTVLQEFYQVAFRKKLYETSRCCRRTWTSGWCTTIPSALIKERCAAGEHRWTRSRMAKGSGRRSS